MWSAAAMVVVILLASCARDSGFCRDHDEMVEATEHADEVRTKLAEEAEGFLIDRARAGEETATERRFRRAVRTQSDATDALAADAPNDVLDDASALERATSLYATAIEEANDLHLPSAKDVRAMAAAQSPEARAARARVDAYAERSC